MGNTIPWSSFVSIQSLQEGGGGLKNILSHLLNMQLDFRLQTLPWYLNLVSFQQLYSIHQPLICRPTYSVDNSPTPETGHLCSPKD